MFAELFSVVVAVITYIKKYFFWYFLSTRGAGYFTKLRCLCRESGQAITSESFRGIIRSFWKSTDLV